MAILNGMQIALVAATHRRPEALETLLQSLQRQTLPSAAFEVSIVVDGRDESEPAYREVLERYRREGLHLCWEFQDNAGQSVARNRAVAATTAPLLCIVDDDMDLEEGFLSAHLEALRAGGARAVVIGRVIPEEGWERQPLYEVVRTAAMLELHNGLASGTLRAQASAFVTQNVALPRALYDAAGRLDERLRLAEDTELGLRLELSGARFLFADRAAAVHRSRIGSYRKWLDRQVEYGRLAEYIFEKLERTARADPLRNLVNGSRLNAFVIHFLCPSDAATWVGISLLRGLGLVLQRIGLTGPAVATHKAILALAYHLGVKQALGSWREVLAAKRAFVSNPERPTDPT